MANHIAILAEPGELVIPRQLAGDIIPQLQKALAKTNADMEKFPGINGLDFRQFMVGSPEAQVDPETGMQMFAFGGPTTGPASTGGNFGGSVSDFSGRDDPFSGPGNESDLGGYFSDITQVSLPSSSIVQAGEGGDSPLQPRPSTPGFMPGIKFDEPLLNEADRPPGIEDELSEYFSTPPQILLAGEEEPVQYYGNEIQRENILGFSSAFDRYRGRGGLQSMANPLFGATQPNQPLSPGSVRGVFDADEFSLTERLQALLSRGIGGLN